MSLEWIPVDDDDDDNDGCGTEKRLSGLVITGLGLIYRTASLPPVTALPPPAGPPST
jgi:hypothetical protein